MPLALDRPAELQKDQENLEGSEKIDRSRHGSTAKIISVIGMAVLAVLAMEKDVASQVINHITLDEIRAETRARDRSLRDCRRGLNMEQIERCTYNIFQYERRRARVQTNVISRLLQETYYRLQKEVFGGDRAIEEQRRRGPISTRARDRATRECAGLNDIESMDDCVDNIFVREFYSAGMGHGTINGVEAMFDGESVRDGSIPIYDSLDRVSLILQLQQQALEAEVVSRAEARRAEQQRRQAEAEARRAEQQRQREHNAENARRRRAGLPSLEQETAQADSRRCQIRAEAFLQDCLGGRHQCTQDVIIFNYQARCSIDECRNMYADRLRQCL